MENGDLLKLNEVEGHSREDGGGGAVHVLTAWGVPRNLLGDEKSTTKLTHYLLSVFFLCNILFIFCNIIILHLLRTLLIFNYSFLVCPQRLKVQSHNLL